MADSPAKRRKTSPTTSVPVNASNTPSRIPIPSQPGSRTPSRRPSFASPTKASLSRHNPQLLNRPSSSGENSGRPGSRGRNLQDIFAQALAETRGRNEDSLKTGRDGSESVTTTQENDPPTEVLIAQNQNQNSRERATTPKARSGGISGNPRRISRSPSKRPERPPYEHPSQLAAMELRDDINPFQKKGLRRSPPTASQASQVEPHIEDIIKNPFKKTGLRRSPIASQNREILVESNAQQVARLEMKKLELRRSPIASQTEQNVGENSVQDQARLEPQNDGLRRSPIESQQLERKGQSSPLFQATPQVRRSALRRSPIAPQTSKFMGQDSTPQPLGVDIQKGRVRTSPNTSLPTEVVEQSNNGPETPPQKDPELDPPPREQMAEGEVQAEVEAQLESELQDSAAPSDPAPDVVERPAQYSVTELLRKASHGEQEIRSNSLKATKSPTRSAVEELLNPFIPRRHEEPELPPTPPQLGIPDPVVTTPPSGIHDTPSKLARRRKGLSDKLKSSPLKPKDPRPQEPSSDAQPQFRDERLPQKPQKAPVAKDQSRRRRSSRFITPVDANATKKKERDDLLRELQQLQADVALANQENERIRIRSESKKKTQAAAPNAEEILAMLLRSTAPEPLSKPQAEQVSILKSMDCFLPFRPRRKPVMLPLSEKPLPSHLPVAFDDPLPYLQAFSPLTYTSSITLPPSSPLASDSSSQELEQPIMQKYVINASHPSGLFAARLAMIADPSLLCITSIDVLRLDMSAEIELGTFIRARAAVNQALGKDITVICWAMARWVEVSIQRARFWCAVEKEFGTSESRTTAMRKKRKRKRNFVDEDENDENDKGNWTRRQLLPNIGRISTELLSDEVELRFEWKIRFDYTGEVESVLAADARMPGSCKSHFLSNSHTISD